MSARFDFDVVAIGGGAAGIVAANVAAGFGARVALVERDRLGGECLWTGCVPSKALIHLAHLRRSGADGPAEPLAAVGAMVLRVQEAEGTEAALTRAGVALRYGEGRFLDRHTFAMDDKTIRARHFVLATGSRPAVPDLPGLRQAGFLTNVEVFAQPAPPESLIVIGGGLIGVELAQAFARLGTRVTLLQRRERLLPRDDAELVAELTALLRGEGLDIRCGATPTRVELDGDRKRVHYRAGDGEHAVTAQEILVAAGRRPNVEGLGLDALGIRIGAQGVETDATLRTRAPNIWACGDVRGVARFSHMAEHEAKAAMRNILLPLRARARMDLVPWATFTDPELAHAGLTEADAAERGIAVDVFRQHFAEDDRALVDGVGVGMVKLVAKRPGGQLLGAQILGPRAGELIQEAILVLTRRGNIREIADAIHVYPTLSIAVQRAAQRWYEALGKPPRMRALTRGYLGAWRAFQR